MSTYIVSWNAAPYSTGGKKYTVITTHNSFAEATDKYRSVKRDPYNSVVKLSQEIEMNDE